MPRPDPARRPSARCKAALRSMRSGRCAHGRRGRFNPSIAPHARGLLLRLNCRMQLCRPDMQVTSQSPVAGHCPAQTTLSRRRHCRFNGLRFNLCRHHPDHVALETCISTAPLPSRSCRFCNMRFSSAVVITIMSLLQHALQQRRRHADHVTFATCDSIAPSPCRSCRFGNMRFSSAVAITIMSLLQHELQQRRRHVDHVFLETCASAAPLPSRSCRFCNMSFNSAVAMPTMPLLQHALQQRRRHADQAATISPSVPGRAAKSLDQRR